MLKKEDFVDEEGLYDYYDEPPRWHLGVNPHGGMCCGISHIQELCVDEEEDDLEERRKNLLDVVEYIFKRKINNKHHLWEVVLTDYNIRTNPNLVKQLKSMGFVLVTRFFNKNSNNHCNVLHLTHRQSLDESPWNKE